ncbi:MAG: MATE family efflux transporter, partial [Spirochaetaceae bacterium]|nr:MATE family efflux transporter [Spirochaetaceae bacterium]
IIIDLGVAPYAAYQIGINVNAFAFMPVFGLSIAVTTIVGQSLGRQDFRGAGIYAFESNIVGIAFITAMGAANWMFASSMASIFTKDAEVIGIAIGMIGLFAAINPFLGVMNVSSSVLRAAGDIAYVTWTALVGLWAFRIGVALLAIKVLGWGLNGVMAGIAADFVVRSTMYGLRVAAGRWKHLKV